MTDERALDYMQRLLDDDLNEQEIEQLHRHLQQCPDAAATFARLQQLSEGLASLPPVQPPTSIVDSILPQLAQLQSEQSSASSERDEEAEVATEAAKQRMQRLTQRQRWRRIIGGATAACAVAAAFIFTYPPSEEKPNEHSPFNMIAAGVSMDQAENADVMDAGDSNKRMANQEIEGIAEEALSLQNAKQDDSAPVAGGGGSNSDEADHNIQESYAADTGIVEQKPTEDMLVTTTSDSSMNQEFSIIDRSTPLSTGSGFGRGLPGAKDAVEEEQVLTESEMFVNADEVESGFKNQGFLYQPEQLGNEQSAKLPTADSSDSYQLEELSGDGKLLVVAMGSRLQVMTADQKAIVHVVQLDAGTITSINWNEDSSTLTYGVKNEDGSIEHRSWETGVKTAPRQAE